jgi:hypothetical protein
MTNILKHFRLPKMQQFVKGYYAIRTFCYSTDFLVLVEEQAGEISGWLVGLVALSNRRRN